MQTAEALQPQPDDRRMPGPGYIPGSLNLDPKRAPAVPSGAARPFAPGEWLQNPDGGWSSEISVTTQMPDGKWAILPSLWLRDGKPYVAQNEDEVLELVQGSGLNFRTYASQQEADAASVEREAAWQRLSPQQAHTVPALWADPAPASAQGTTPPDWWTTLKTQVHQFLGGP